MWTDFSRFILFSLSSTWKLSFRRFSSISLLFVVAPYLNGRPVKVVQFNFANYSITLRDGCLLSSYKASRAFLWKCKCSESRQQENFIPLQEPNSSKSTESHFPHKSTNNAHILSDDSTEMVVGKRNLKDTDANAKIVFFVAHDKRYDLFLLSGENTDAHPLFDWKISKTDHVRLVINSFVCSLDCENYTKIPSKMFHSRKYTVLDSFQFVQKIPVAPSSEGILFSRWQNSLWNRGPL